MVPSVARTIRTYNFAFGSLRNAMGNEMCAGDRQEDTEEDQERKAIRVYEPPAASGRGHRRRSGSKTKRASSKDLKNAFKDALKPTKTGRKRRRSEEDIEEESSFCEKRKLKIENFVNAGYKFWREKKYQQAKVEFEKSKDAAMDALKEIKSMEKIEWEKALVMLKEHLAKAYGNLARCCEGEQDHKGAIKNYYPCLKLIKELGDFELMAKLYNNVAVAYLKSGELARSFHFHEKTVEVYKKIGKDYEIVEKRMKFIKHRIAAEKDVISASEDGGESNTEYVDDDNSKVGQRTYGRADSSTTNEDVMS